MKNILFLLFLTFTNIQSQEYYTAKLLLVNGEINEGKATLPKNKLFETTIKIKKDKNKIASIINSNDIYQILYTINNNEYLFERNNLGIITNPFKKQRTSTYSGKEWFLVTYRHSLIKAYISTQSYYVNKKGILTAYSYEGRNIAFGTSYLLIRPNEKAPMVISMANLGNSKFRKWASLYFKENTELVARIKNKEFKGFQTDELAKAYVLYQ